MGLIDIKNFDSNQTAWKIMGMDINLSGIDESYQLTFSGIVDYVNEVWTGVKQDNPKTADTQKICILTAIKIAENFTKLKNLQENISNVNEKKLNVLIKQLENVDLAK
ncbi:MAG: cell division protein ZapA [Elusimicrobiota bacterium]|nr:cell division protein ZapA [Elusimicrobiota bacterium]